MILATFLEGTIMIFNERGRSHLSFQMMLTESRAYHKGGSGDGYRKCKHQHQPTELIFCMISFILYVNLFLFELILLFGSTQTAK